MMAEFYALVSSLGMAVGGFFYRDSVKHVSSLWLNAFKCVVGFICFFVWCLTLDQISIVQLPYSEILFLLFSGLLGQNISDYFMIRSYQSLGPSKTLILFRTQPVILLVGGFLFLAQEIGLNELLAIGAFTLCTLSLAWKDTDGTWSFTQIRLAIGAIFFDSAGLIIMKVIMNRNPQLRLEEVILLRLLGSVIGLLPLVILGRIKPIREWKALAPRRQLIVIAGTFIAMFVVLWTWMKAIAIGKLAVVAAVIGLSPLFALLGEIYFDKKRPGARIIFALLLTYLGFYFLVHRG